MICKYDIDIYLQIYEEYSQKKKFLNPFLFF